MHGAGDDDVPARVEQPHERDLAAGEPGCGERQQRQRGSLVACERGVSGAAKQCDLFAQPASAGRRPCRREHAPGDLGDPVGERDLVRAQRLAAVPTAEDQADGRSCGIAQGDGDHGLGPLLALVRDLRGIGRDPRVLRLERSAREAIGDTQRPALHEPRATSDRGGDHQPPVRLGQRHGAPVAAQRLGGRPRDLGEGAIDVDEAAASAPAASASGRAAPRDGAGSPGERPRPPPPRQRRPARPAARRLLRARLRHEPRRRRTPAGPIRARRAARAGRMPAAGRRRPRVPRADRVVPRRPPRDAVAQAVLERVERHVDRLAHRAERHAVRSHGVMRSERGALEQHGAPRDEQRDRRAEPSSTVGSGSTSMRGSGYARPTTVPALAVRSFRCLTGPDGDGAGFQSPKTQRSRCSYSASSSSVDRHGSTRDGGAATRRREGLLFWTFALLLAGLVGLIGYGVVIVTRSVLG